MSQCSFFARDRNIAQMNLNIKRKPVDLKAKVTFGTMGSRDRTSIRILFLHLSFFRSLISALFYIL